MYPYKLYIHSIPYPKNMNKKLKEMIDQQKQRIVNIRETKHQQAQRIVNIRKIESMEKALIALLALYTK